MEDDAMTKTSFVTIFLLTAFVVAFQAPAMLTTTRAAELPAETAAGSPIALTITNPLPKATTVILSGAKAYTINVPQGATITKTIDPGKYKYSYQGCLNKAKKGNLKTKGATATLKIAPCKMATWVFYNADKSQPYTLRLNGWVDYNITVGPGQVLRFSFVADTYQATERACGETYNFTWKVNGKKSWIIYACK
jgi:hypothetical protein